MFLSSNNVTLFLFTSGILLNHCLILIPAPHDLLGPLFLAVLLLFCPLENSPQLAQLYRLRLQRGAALIQQLFLLERTTFLSLILDREARSSF